VSEIGVQDLGPRRAIYVGRGGVIPGATNCDIYVTDHAVFGGTLRNCLIIFDKQLTNDADAWENEGGAL
jgi:hypothetical protein